jgi:outer membrane protein assembly factor BamB
MSDPVVTITQTDEATPRKPLRLWPGVAAAVLLFVIRFAVPLVIPEATIFGVIGGVVGALAIIVWWVVFSRARWSERVGAIVLMIVALFATSRIVHPSVANGMMGMMLPIFAVPVLSLALVVWAVASRDLASGARRATMVGAILLACGIFTLVRTGGINGAGVSDLHWRWTETPEDRLLAQAADESLDSAQRGRAAPSSTPRTAEAADTRVAGQASAEPTAPTPAPTIAETPDKRVPAPTRVEPKAHAADPRSTKTEAEWPGFRGPARDGVVRGVQIETDWSARPPVEMWRRPIGPGWSSFAVQGDVLYTQEQRGEDETVAAYKVTTGEPVWRHRDAVRFWESNGGAGPRATPTLSNDRVYTFGATGIVNALDARDGAVVWSRNAASDTGAKLPGWGFAGSPLVVDDVVIVAASGALVAYEIATGKPRWFGPAGGGGYSSPHLATIDGVPQILLLRGARTVSVAPADGTLLWEHSWQPAVSIVQPALTADGDVLITAGDAMGGNGIRRIAVGHGASGWTVAERWTSNGLKPYFNDLVVHKGHAFGFDGSILACIDLKDGARKWKGGRYGNGQMVLLADQDLLLVLSEEGELALVGATPDQFRELARFPAIQGKTWNHPVLVGEVLLVRNGEEMVAFRLSLAAR